MGKYLNWADAKHYVIIDNEDVARGTGYGLIFTSAYKADIESWLDDNETNWNSLTAYKYENGKWNDIIHYEKHVIAFPPPEY